MILKRALSGLHLLDFATDATGSAAILRLAYQWAKAIRIEPFVCMCDWSSVDLSL